MDNAVLVGKLTIQIIPILQEHNINTKEWLPVDVGEEKEGGQGNGTKRN